MSDADLMAETATRRAARYDRLTITFHWVTAALVIGLFALAELWGFAPKGSPLRREMISLHISLGVALAVLYLLRVVWRSTASRMPPAAKGMQQLAARLVHLTFYGLLAAQTLLGFLFAWAKGSLHVFGLFQIPSPLAIGPVWHHRVAVLHDDAAWAIIILAAGHASMALAHRYILRDRVLQRMLPAAAPR